MVYKYLASKATYGVRAILRPKAAISEPKIYKVEDWNWAERVSYSAEVSEFVHGHPFCDACTFSSFIDGGNESLVIVLVLVRL